ncbi:MAG: 2,3-bisphosphoglycerate-independent phosphoglycerate mutase [Candidatus Brennerbacteria bacterium]|nr:2,3-bisphosphoglycerate-independent phosphoglycerate mutase [Candidatus Brennerbacteria bacterium]
MKRTYLLAILDGWGLGPSDQGNPIYAARPETIATIETRYPGVALQASGLAVGLPWDEEGNSEAGHITLGAGRPSEQHSERITRAIAQGTFTKNEALRGAFTHARARHSTLHLVGLLTSGLVHASFSHLEALIRMADDYPEVLVALHLMTDGIDSAPREARTLVPKVLAASATHPNVRLASLGGRYYGMDRDGHFDRTAVAYRALAGEAPFAASWEAALQETYAKGLNDEFVEPRKLPEFRPVARGDTVIFFNFREDSIRQLADAFISPTFNAFPRTRLEDAYFVTMTAYREHSPARAAFPAEPMAHSLGETIAAHGLRQLRIAETEKYAHVTYFFNGRREEPFPNEFRILVPSLSAFHKDTHPEMMARAVTDRAMLALREGSFDFILMNYANPDIIAHTGNYAATVAAIETVDRELRRLLTAVEEGGHAALITADHGNAEVLIDLKTGEPETKHNPSPVPCWLVAPEVARPSLGPASLNPLRPRANQVEGFLADVAPTILDLMRIPKPPEMTGVSLLPYFRES